MAAPIPGYMDTVVQAPTLRAKNIVLNYGWMYRLSVEIGAETDLNLKKLAQLGFQHCRMFVTLTTSPSAELIAAAEKAFAAEGVEWATRAAMAADITALRTGATNLRNFVNTNVATGGVLTFSSRAFSVNGDETETPILVTKTQAIGDAVAALRALFA